MNTSCPHQCLRCDHMEHPQFYDPDLLRQWGQKRQSRMSREDRTFVFRQRAIAKFEYGMELPPTVELYVDDRRKVDEWRTD